MLSKRLQSLAESSDSTGGFVKPISVSRLFSARFQFVIYAAYSVQQICILRFNAINDLCGV
jgi:hypothetical protein